MLQDFEVARKEFDGVRAKENFLNENKICQIISNDGDSSAGIVKPWFSYAIAAENDDVKYNICFEVAQCDLRTYLSDSSNSPKDAKDRMENVTRMWNVSHGLVWLSELVENKRWKLKQSKILHLDLHWANILIGGKDSTFKISDFGGAVRREDIETTDAAGTTSPIILNGAFAAPGRTPTETSDVWSFGCILLLVLLFNYEGVGGLNEFMASLLRNANIARFWDESTGKMSLETKGCIDHLRRRIAKEPDRLITEGLLKMLEENVLVPFKKRKGIAYVKETIKACLDKQSTVEPQTRLTRTPNKGKFFHHCAHASNGRFEVCHEDTAGYTMRVWIWHDMMAVELPLLEPVSVPRPTSTSSEPQRIYTRSCSCTDDYVCQVITNRDPIEVGSDASALFIVRLTLCIAAALQDTTDSQSAGFEGLYQADEYI
jgi:serine/threonine protein kinase